MKPGRYFSLIAGIAFLSLGLAGLLPVLVQTPAEIPPSVAEYGVTDGYGQLLGLFPINTAESILYLVTGTFGVAAAAALDSARLYAGLVAVTYGAFAVLGLIPVADTFFGLFPLYGADVALHGAIAAIAIYFGFFATPNLQAVLEQEVGENA